MEVSSGPFVSGAYHRRRVAPGPPRPAGRRLRRARRRRARAAHVRAELPGRAAAGVDAGGQRRRGARAWPAARPATSGSAAGSTPRTSSRTTRIGRWSSAGPGSRCVATARWVTFEDGRERVQFEVRDGLEGIVVDDATLDSGLVVVPRESVGTAADVADRVPAGTPPDAPVRLRVEQVSSVEHAIVLGVPGLDETGRAAAVGGTRPAARADHARTRRGDAAPDRWRARAGRWSRRHAWPAGLGLVVIGGIAGRDRGRVVTRARAGGEVRRGRHGRRRMARLRERGAGRLAEPGADRRRPAQLRPGSRAGRRPAVRAAGGRRHRGRVGDRDPRLRAVDRPSRRLNGLGPSDYWQEL